MKRTMLFRPIANPRRTRLAALTDAEPQRQAEQDTEVAKDDSTEKAAQTARRAGADETPARPMPQQTANPRRTVLTEPPAGPAPAE